MSAGPILIFDKSTLQSLNVDEAVWLDHSYLCNITPLFFIETLADLEKEVRAGRTSDQVVGSLAMKTPDMGSSVNVHHTTLILDELLGVDIVDTRTGRPHIGGGVPMELGGKSGVMFKPSQEDEAFRRWQEGDFLTIERVAAKAWRDALSKIDLESVYSLFKERLPQWNKPKGLDEVKRDVDNVLVHQDQENVLRMALSLVGVPSDYWHAILERWQKTNRPSVRDFAPYFAYVFSVDLFFYFAVAADLIGRGRPSHKIDMAYLYYLPFCMVFSSNDKLHQTIVPFFLRERQTFVSGTDLKADLQALDQHYSSLPEEIKNRGLATFAFYPPDDTRFLITRLWDKHMNPRWREHKHEHDAWSSKKEKRDAPSPLMEAIRSAEIKGAPMKPHVPTRMSEPNHIVIKRNVRAKKGKWERFPEVMRNRRKNERGEWEDTP